jgi:hypothetical protein
MTRLSYILRMSKSFCFFGMFANLTCFVLHQFLDKTDSISLALIALMTSHQVFNVVVERMFRHKNHMTNIRSTRQTNQFSVRGFDDLIGERNASTVITDTLTHFYSKYMSLDIYFITFHFLSSLGFLPEILFFSLYSIICCMKRMTSSLHSSLPSARS